MTDAAARRSEPSYTRTFFEHAPCPAWILSEATRRILDVNRAAVEQYGYTRAEFLELSLDTLVPRGERGTQRAFWRRARRGRIDGHCRHETKHGQLLDVHLVAARVRDGRRRSQLTCLAWPRASAIPWDGSRAWQVFEHAPIALLHVDRTGRVVDANDLAAQLLQRSRKALCGLSLEYLAAMESAPLAREVVDVLGRGKGWRGTVRLRSLGARVFDADLRAAARAAADLHVIAFDDVSDRNRADAALRRSGERYRRLSDRDRTVREEERARIARELHDQLGQSLSAFKMDLAWLAAIEERGEPATARAAIAVMMDRVDTAISIVRRIAGDLRPGVLDRLGLLAAIEWQAAEFERRSGVRCQVVCQGECPPFDRAQSTEIFRIVQEMLVNVDRHAGASAVKLSMTCSPGRVVLRVSDNGRGIPPEAIDSEQSLGLIGMRERATMLGGVLTVSRKTRRGTDVLLVIPSAPHLVGRGAVMRTSEQ